MKKIISLLLSIILLFGVLSGCSEPINSTPSVTEDEAQDSTEPSRTVFEGEGYITREQVVDALKAWIEEGSGELPETELEIESLEIEIKDSMIEQIHFRDTFNEEDSIESVVYFLKVLTSLYKLSEVVEGDYEEAVILDVEHNRAKVNLMALNPELSAFMIEVISNGDGTYCFDIVDAMHTLNLLAVSSTLEDY